VKKKLLALGLWLLAFSIEAAAKSFKKKLRLGQAKS